MIVCYVYNAWIAALNVTSVLLTNTFRDIAFAISGQVANFNHVLKHSHAAAPVKMIVCYLV